MATIPCENLLKILSKWGIDENDLGAQLNIAKSTYSKRKRENGHLIAFTKSELFYIQHLLNLSTQDLGLPIDYFTIDEPFAAAAKQSDDSSLVTFNSIETDQQSQRTFLSSYFKTMKQQVSKIKESFLVADYLHRYESIMMKWDEENYFKEDKDYFTKLESQLEKGKKKKYVRIAQLPLFHSHDNSSLEESYQTLEGKSMENAYLLFAIENLFHDTFQHILRCFRSEKIDFDFFIMKHALRPYNCYIIDSHTMISEYFRYDDRAIPKHDLLFVNSKASLRNQHLIDHHLLDFRRVDSWAAHPKHLVTKVKWAKLTYGLASLIENLQKHTMHKQAELKRIQNKQAPNLADLCKSNKVEEKLEELSSRLENLLKKQAILQEFSIDPQASRPGPIDQPI